MGDLYHINADEFVQARLRWGAGGDAGSRYIRFLNGTFRPISGGKTRGKTIGVHSFPHLQHMNRRFALEQRKIREEVC